MDGLGIQAVNRELLNANADAFTVRTELRRVHTLNGCDAIAEVTRVRGEQGILKNIGSLSEIAKKEIRTGVFGTFIITKSPLPFIAAEYIHRLQSRRPHIFHVDIFHSPVDT